MEREYISGGYYLSRFAQRAEYMSADLIPERVISGSGCICRFFPDDWSLRWSGVSLEERIEAASRFGVSEGDLARVMEWATGSFDDSFGWPNVFFTLDAARQARARQLPEDLEVIVFGLGLHESQAEEFLTVAQPPEQQAGFAPVGQTGVFQCVSRGTGIDAGESVGFGLLATQYGLLTCSWLCNGLETECANELGIRPNGAGLIGTYDEASRCARHVSVNYPTLWLPWLLTIYASQ